ncbi:hypothetical protein [Actinoplanes friuliensis]|uniref:Uncharacterized protein n=1 Tax=Actinoplanes friuliensis DSM 7358 TaxID=1246995 RepID=U5W9H9_9ACTN|nr:hypothetical protein [Actinoplanes friuliensis]AGZ44630.1 hypothetical protein AFR_31850 [Actinoplanes friuliensis DSM 7358]
MARVFSSWTGRIALVTGATAAVLAVITMLVALGAGSGGQVGALVVSIVFAAGAFAVRKRNPA